jgi:acetyl-CoA synthetase
VPTYPDAGRFWKIADHKVSVFYTAPTAIRSLIKAADADDKVHPKSYDLSSLRIWARWASRSIRRRGCGTQARRRRALPDRRHLLADRNRRPHDHAAAGRHAAVPGSCTLPLPGIMAAIVDETGQDVPTGKAASWWSSVRGRR